MIRWSPGTELASLHGAMDRLYEDFFGPSGGGGGQRQPLATYVLPLDIREVESGYEIQAPVPGFTPEDVDITFSENVLKILAQRPEQSTQNQGGYLRKEIAHGHYQRSIQLPGDINENDITAAFENGVLTITVPKAPRPQPKKIQVSGEPQTKARKQVNGRAPQPASR